MMTFQECKELQAHCDAECKQWGDVLSSFPKGDMNLTPDWVKSSPEYQRAARGMAIAFKQFQNINAYLVKHYSKELKQERDAKRQAMLDRNKTF